jgi:uncharacterized membrane protein YukC
MLLNDSFLCSKLNVRDMITKMRKPSSLILAIAAAMFHRADRVVPILQPENYLHRKQTLLPLFREQGIHKRIPW